MSTGIHQEHLPLTPSTNNSPTTHTLSLDTSNHPLNSPSIVIGSDSHEIPSNGIFRWASLRRITRKIYSAPKKSHPTAIISSANSSANTILGLPTVIATSGVIVVGTAKGWAMVFDYASNLKTVLGSDVIGRDAGAVSALSISPIILSLPLAISWVISISTISPSRTNLPGR